MGNKKNKRPSQQTVVKVNKNPKNIVDPDTWKDKTPVWVFSKHDKEHDRWSCKYCDNFYEKIILKLSDFEGMTWKEITRQTHDNGSSSNHFINIDSLSHEAQKRLYSMKIFIDQIFSLRLNNKVRLIGILENGTFRILWYDENHEICPSKKKHT